MGMYFYEIIMCKHLSCRGLPGGALQKLFLHHYVITKRV